jgi:ribosomal protein S12 methylthiotransferase
MASQVSEKVKKKRRELAMAEQLKVARSISESFLGRELRVLVEKAARAEELANVSSWEHGLILNKKQAPLPRGSYLVGRGEPDAPDIDGRVFIRGGTLPIGEFARVKVIGHTDYDLIAEPLIS